jgi:hypothetical protein
MLSDFLQETAYRPLSGGHVSKPSQPFGTAKMHRHRRWIYFSKIAENEGRLVTYTGFAQVITVVQNYY